MGNFFLTSAIGALMLFSPQTEQAYPEQITLRETDLHAITSQAEITSTHLTYRQQNITIAPVEIAEKDESEPVIPLNTKVIQPKTASITVSKPIVPLPAPSELEALVNKYASQYGARADMMMIIMKCESGYNPNALNGSFAGLFQFMSTTWSSNRRAMGLDPNPALRTNAEEAIRTAAFKMGRDGYGAWPACSQKALSSLNLNN